MRNPKTKGYAIFEKSNQTVNGKVCIKMGGSHESQYNIDCCPGLKVIDGGSKRAKDYSSSNQACIISLRDGMWICTTCGDGLCEGIESDCNCKEDCLINKDKDEQTTRLKQQFIKFIGIS